MSIKRFFAILAIGTLFLTNSSISLANEVENAKRVRCLDRIRDFSFGSIMSYIACLYASKISNIFHSEKEFSKAVKDISGSTTHKVATRGNIFKSLSNDVIEKANMESIMRPIRYQKNLFFSGSERELFHAFGLFSISIPTAMLFSAKAFSKTTWSNIFKNKKASLAAYLLLGATSSYLGINAFHSTLPYFVEPGCLSLWQTVGLGVSSLISGLGACVYLKKTLAKSDSDQSA